MVDEVRDLLLIQATARIRLGFQALPGTTGFHDVVLQGDEEDGASGVALAARATAQLVIQPLGAEAPNTDHVQSPGLEGGVAGGFVLAAELDVRTAACHLGGDGDVAGASCFGDDGGLGLVVLRVQDRAFHAAGRKRLGDALGGGDILGTDELRLAGLLDREDVFDDGGVALLVGGVDAVGLVEALGRHVRVDDRDLQAVELAQLVPGRQRRAGHAADGRVQADQGLNGDLIQDAAAVGDAQPLLGLHRGLQTIRPALQVGDAPAGAVDEGDGAVLDDVVDVPDEQVLGVQGDVDLDERLTGVLAVLALRVQGVDAEGVLDELRPLIREEDVAAVRGDCEVLVFLHPLDQLGDLAGRGGAGLAACEDEWNEGFVDEHGVRLVNNGDVRGGADDLGALGGQVVAEDVEAELVDRAEDDVPLVDLATFVGGQFLLDGAVGEPEEVEHRPHPFVVAGCEEAVDGDDVDAFALQCVADGGHRAGQGFALAGGHFGDVPVEQGEGALELDVEGGDAEGAASDLPEDGEQLRDVRDASLLALRCLDDRVCCGGAELVVGGAGVALGVGLCDDRPGLLLILLRRRAHRTPEPVKCSHVLFYNLVSDRRLLMRRPLYRAARTCPPKVGHLAVQGWSSTYA